MKKFDYEIKDPVGIHARPAGLLVKAASEYNSDITVKKGEKTADAKKIFSLMGLSVKHGDTISVEISGEDESAALECIKSLFEENF